MSLIIELYVVFALTTAILFFAWVTLPCVEVLSSVRPHNPLVDYKYVAYLTGIIGGAIMAPILFPIILSQTKRERFIKVFVQSAMDDE